MTKEELAQKIKDSNYTCDGINCSECIRVNGFGCCLQCDKKLFVSLVLPAKSKKDKLEKRIEELERKLEQTEKDLADYQFNYPTIKELTEGTCFAHLKSLEKENAELKADNDARKFAMAMSEKVEEQLREQIKQIEKVSDYNADQLTKAKDIIQQFLIQNPISDWLVEKAEKFIKEIEK